MYPSYSSIDAQAQLMVDSGDITRIDTAELMPDWSFFIHRNY
jgi:hypothetical protein